MGREQFTEPINLIGGRRVEGEAKVDNVGVVKLLVKD